jgi:hypothetical protein
MSARSITVTASRRSSRACSFEKPSPSGLETGRSALGNSRALGGRLSSIDG